MNAPNSAFLSVNNIEVIYNHVILVLKGVSLSVQEGSIVALLGGNGAGKTTTLRAVSNLLKGERGEVTKGSVEYKGERVEAMTPADLVKRGVVQVMEGRHCFGHLTIEENLRTGAYTRTDGKAAVEETLEKVYNYFPRLKTRRNSQAAYTSGGGTADVRDWPCVDGQASSGAAGRTLDGPRAADRRGGVRDRQGSERQGEGELPAR